MSNRPPFRRSLLTSMALVVGFGSVHVFASGPFDAEPRNVGEQKTFQHEQFSHAQFSHADFQPNAVPFNAGNSFSPQQETSFSQYNAGRFDNGLDSLSVSQDADGQRFSDEAQERFPNMKMRFENDAFQNLNFN